MMQAQSMRGFRLLFGHPSSLRCAEHMFENPPDLLTTLFHLINFYRDIFDILSVKQKAAPAKNASQNEKQSMQKSGVQMSGTASTHCEQNSHAPIALKKLTPDFIQNKVPFALNHKRETVETIFIYSTSTGLYLHLHLVNG